MTSKREVEGEPETREQRSARLAADRPRYDLARIIRGHVFHSSRPWPDGSQPTAPNWNPGCSCGEGMYYFNHDLHLAGALLEAGYAQRNQKTPR